MSGEPPVVATGFLERPYSHDLAGADVAVLGVPYDLATTGRAGAREGPAAIRRASLELSWEKQRWPWRFALADRLGVIDYGDVAFKAGDSEAMVTALQGHTRDVLAAGTRLLALGGDHFISLPLLRAHAALHGPLALIHFDAHADADAVEGRVHHGNMFDQALREGLLDAEHSVQIGLRSHYEFDHHPFSVLDADSVHAVTPGVTASRIASRVGAQKAYLSFDIDCLDPAFAPGTGTPTPGGLSTSQALQILRGLVGLDLVGMDVVEVAPAYDHADITALAAAAIACELLHVVAARPDDLAATRRGQPD